MATVWGYKRIFRWTFFIRFNIFLNTKSIEHIDMCSLKANYYSHFSRSICECPSNRQVDHLVRHLRMFLWASIMSFTSLSSSLALYFLQHKLCWKKLYAGKTIWKRLKVKAYSFQSPVGFNKPNGAWCLHPFIFASHSWPR